MVGKKYMFNFALFFLVYSVLELSSAININCSNFYSTIGKILICAFIGIFLSDVLGYRILKDKIDPKNKAVFITGCDTGVGNRLAKQLDSRGYDVFAGCLSPLQGGGLELTKTCSQRLRTVQVDVTKDSDVLAAKEFIKKNLGDSELWAVVNNAGIYRGFRVELCPLKHFNDSFDVNVMGVVRVSKAFLPLLRKSKGRLINVNSLSGRLSVAVMSAYTVSKHASAALTECLQQEMSGSGVKVISIEPEFFRTPLISKGLLENLLADAKKNLDDDSKDVYNERRIAKTAKAEKVLFDLASPDVAIFVDETERAISSVYPSMRYTPCRNWIAKLIFYSAQQLPQPVINTSVIVLEQLFARSKRLDQKTNKKIQ